MLPSVRRYRPVVVATALEILSEPLSLLLLLSALAVAVFAPAVHYHQFGDPARMARDAGFSALFMFGVLFAVFGTIRSFRREVESGTFEMAMAHPLSAGGFFFAKALGAFLAYLVFAATVSGTSTTIVLGVLAAWLMDARTGGSLLVCWPALAAGVSVILLPLLVAAALNRFARFRFVLTAFSVACVLSLGFGAVAAFLAPAVVARQVPVVVLVLLPTAVMASAAAAFSIRFRANAAASAVALMFLLALPAVGNYYLPNALADGGRVPWSYVAAAAATSLLAVAAFAVWGFGLCSRR